MKRTLIKITVLGAFDPKGTAGLPELFAEAAAEMMRQHASAVTVTSEHDVATVEIAGDPDDSDDLIAALDQHFPTDGLMVGGLPNVQMLGRNGLFRNAKLTRVSDRLELWLGTAKERFPLLSFIGTSRAEK